MPEALSFTDIDRQHLELLPARTVMSTLTTAKGTGTSTSGDATSTGGTNSTSNSTGGVADAVKPITGLFAGFFQTLPLLKPQ